MDSFKSLISFDTSAVEKGNAALDLLKRGGQAALQNQIQLQVANLLLTKQQ
jgi:hypothetical protein